MKIFKNSKLIGIYQNVNNNKNLNLKMSLKAKLISISSNFIRAKSRIKKFNSRKNTNKKSL